MGETDIVSLDPSLQKQVESARAALNRGKAGQALELCVAVLDAEPGCLAVRKLERAARLKFAASRRSVVSKLMTAVSAAPLLLGASRQLKEEPRAALVTAERLLRGNPQNVAALSLLGQAAAALGWKATAVFAHEAACDLEPERPDLWLSLGHAYLAAGRSKDSVHAAEEAVRLNPNASEGHVLLREATVSLTITQGNWDKGGGFRSKLGGETKVAG